MKRSIRLSFLFLFALCFGLQAQNLKVENYQLKNGLQIYLCEDHSKAEVFGMVAVRAGGKNDPKDATGMAHYQEHMLFKGTTELGTTNWEKEKPHIDRIFELYDELGKTKDDSARAKIQREINQESVAAGQYTILNETSALIKQMGGTNLNAGTGWDETVYYNAFPPGQVEKWIDLYSHRFMNPVFRAFQAELEVVYEEKNMYADNFITALLENFNKNFYKKHPYGQQTIIGTGEDLKNPSLTKMYEFFRTYYVANNMAVIMVGDFNSEEVKPMLEAKFGQWESGKLPKQEVYEEKPFNGREFVEGKFSPVKLGLFGFRSIPSGHEDELALEAFNSLLSNESGTGALDKLALNNKVMEAQIIPMHNADYGAEIIFAVPKLIGQKLATAEKLVLDEVYKVRDGGFEDWQLESVKKELYRNFMLSQESYENVATLISESFLRKTDLNKINTTPAEIKSLTREKVMAVAKKYYGENFLAFHSKMGFPKKDKVDKPGYEPVKTKTNAKSDFAKNFEKIPSRTHTPKFVNLNKDILCSDLSKNVKLRWTKNPMNDIFNLDIEFRTGTNQLKQADAVAQLMNMAGTKKHSRDEFKKEMSLLGCTYSIGSGENYFTVSLEGLEEDLETALKLIADLIESPVINKDDIKKLYQDTKTGRKMDQDDPSSVAEALFDYVRFGKNSPEKTRMSLKSIKRMKVEDFNAYHKQIINAGADVHFCGQNSSDKVSGLISKNINFGEAKNKEDFLSKHEVNHYKENTIYFVHRKDALQSNIYFLINGGKFSNENLAVKKAFNTYFGGGFSGLVLQEIREYRSMAYSAAAFYLNPPLKNMEDYFLGFIGTQADKSIEAIKIFNDLVRNMPEKPERMDFINPFLKESIVTDRPHFRHLSQSAMTWEQNGFKQDPSKLLWEQAKGMNFDKIVDFQHKNLKDKPMVITIVGNKKKIDMKELEKFGKVVFLKEKELYTK